MYRYDSYDHRFVAERVAQFRDQTRRFLAGELTEDEFRPLRLQNGLYIQKYAPMLRIAIPYGLLSSTQLRKLAHIGRKYDRGYGHFTTRQNIQFNWPRLEDVPDILAELATVEMHAIQTSGNCVRNITSDHFAGVAADEVVDPRAYCELFRQWSMFHPEFAYLPRKFKIAVCGSATDRAATLVHDIGVHAVRNATGEIGFRVLVGGGLGRTPMIGHVIREFLPREEILNYLDAILRVYNRFGRRDNKYKARIKILVKEMTPEVFARHVEATVQMPLQRLEHGLELHRLHPTRSLVMASAVCPPAAIGAAVTSHPMAATAVGTVAAVGSAWWQIEEQRSGAREASPVGYLLDVRDRLTPRTLMARVRRVLTGTYGVGHR